MHQVDKADNQLCGATYIELYEARPFPQPKRPAPPRPAPTRLTPGGARAQAGLDLPTAKSPATLADVKRVFDAEIKMGASDDNTWDIIDLTFMGVAPLSRLGAVTGDAKYFEKQFDLFNYALTGADGAGHQKGLPLWNATVGLFFRDQTFSGTGEYWGRGNGCEPSAPPPPAPNRARSGSG